MKPAELEVESLEGVLRALIEAINSGDATKVHALYAPNMRAAFPLAETADFIHRVVQGVGKLKKARLAGKRHDVYLVEAERETARVELHVDADGKITGLRITPEPDPDPPVAKSDALASLPIQGEWLVGWGGDRPELNAHVGVRNQRRAADLLVVGADGKTYRSDGKTNADYRAYGQPVLAVADGTVVMVVDGVPDNVPGQKNTDFIPGNCIIIRHSPTLHSMYAHLKPGSPRVKVGAAVKSAAPIGLCGNSGNSSEPHLHFQVQDGPGLDSSGVEAVFANVTLTRDGKTERVNGYTFLKGDKVSRAVP